ncbi:MAG: FkbM family methyltransferase [Gammaproteobacteria bacterium]|nr:FkbM family methyltransferase [Gammaproteobacteria bacterium]
MNGNFFAAPILETVAWITRNFQQFRGRWRLLQLLDRQESRVSMLAPGPRSVGGGFSLYIDPGDFNGRRYFSHGINPREPISQIFYRVLRRGDCVLDVGANVGYFTVLASRLIGKTGRVHAFEASPLLQSCLDVAVANPNCNVMVHHSAVADHEGELIFNCSTGGHSGKSSIRNLDGLETESFSVKCTRLDSFMDNLATVRLIKMDIEGAEMMALRGATGIIDRDRPLLLIELTDVFCEALAAAPMILSAGCVIWTTRFALSTRP